MPSTARTWFLRYGGAVVAVGLATAARWALDPYMGGRQPLATFYFAIIAAAWLAGLGPSIVAGVLSVVSAVLFIPPVGSLRPESAPDLVRIGMFAAVCSAFVGFAEAGRRARRRLELEAEERSRAEGALRASEIRLRQLADTMPQIVWTAVADGSVDYFNGRFYEYTGLTPGRALAPEGWRAIVHAEDLPSLAALRAEAVDRGEVFEAEVRLRDRAGGYRWHLLRSAPVHDEAGRLARRFGTATDIDDRRRAEEALRKGEQRLRLALDAARMVAWERDLRTGEAFVSDSAVEVLGLTGGGLLPAEAVAATIHPDDLGTYVEAVAAATRERRRYTVQIRVNRPSDGAVIWAESRGEPIFGADGSIAGFSGVVIDITERRLAEEALREADRRKDELLASLRESEDTFRTLADSIPQLAWMARPDGHIFWYNRRWYEYTGAAPEEMEGWGWQSVHDPAELPRVLAKFRAAIEANEPWEDTFALRRRDGAMRWHLSRALPLRDEHGRIVRWFGTNTDVTEHREMERALREADRRKDEFLAMLAHELRNPLAPIRNALRLMARAGGPSVDDEADRAMAERQVVHLARLVDDLMDVSRIATGKIELRKEPVDLGAVAARAVEAIGSTIEARGHAFEVSLPSAPIPLEADPTRLEQVFWNLLSNAAKYTDPGGRIGLSAAREGDEAVVRVEDTGIGIEPAMLPKIFDMFVQADGLEGRAQGGLGLGLSLVKSLVALHGGRVEARSAGAGLGSAFVVRLPVARKAAPARVADRKPNGQPPRCRVLVVDDNVDAAVTLGRLLSRLYGQDVRVAHDGPSALSGAEEFRPEVVLLDIGMPGMDGYEVARRLRSRPESARALLVALTGWGQESDRQKSRQAGIDHHLVKPVEPEVLRQILASRDEPGAVV